MVKKKVERELVKNRGIEGEGEGRQERRDNV